MAVPIPVAGNPRQVRSGRGTDDFDLWTWWRFGNDLRFHCEDAWNDLRGSFWSWSWFLGFKVRRRSLGGRMRRGQTRACATDGDQKADGQYTKRQN